MPVVADAQTPPACPDAPAEYTGSDPVVNELRALRVDVRTVCLAEVDRAESTSSAVAGVSTALGSLEQDADAATRHSALLAAVEANAPVDGSPEVVEAVDAAQLELDAALWFLAGLACALFAGYFFAREALS